MVSYVFPVFVFRLIEGGSMKTHVCCHFRTERESTNHHEVNNLVSSTSVNNSSTAFTQDVLEFSSN